MKLKQAVIAGLLLGAVSSFVPTASEAQTWRERVCADSRDYAQEARAELRALIRANRRLLQNVGEMTTEERQELRQATAQLRARRQMLKYVIVRIDSGRPTAAQCQRMDVYTTRVASLA